MVLRVAVAEWPDFAARVSGASLAAARKNKEPFLARKNTENEEEELLLSDEEAERLGRAASCLSRLASSAKGLASTGLLPYNLSPLLKRIDQVVSLYESCGDAEEEETENEGCLASGGGKRCSGEGGCE